MVEPKEVFKVSFKKAGNCDLIVHDNGNIFLVWETSADIPDNIYHNISLTPVCYGNAHNALKIERIKP